MEVKEVLDLTKKNLRESNFSELTIINYCFFIEKFLLHCKKPLEAISSEDLQSYLSRLLQKSSSTVALATAALKFFFSQILKKPFPEFNFPKKEKSASSFLTQEEIKKMLAAADTKKSRLIIALLYASGMKVSELISLKPQDLDLEKNLGIIRKSLGSSRSFPLSQKLAEELKVYLREYKGLYLFSLHKPLTPRNIQKIVKNTAKRARIEKKTTPHSLRNSFAKHLLDSGVDEKVTANLLGYTTRRNIFDLNLQDQLLKIKNPYDSLE